MEQCKNGNAFVLGFFIFLGLSVLGYLLGSSAIKFKEYERSVTAKCLSEREYPADIVIWPIQFTEARDRNNPHIKKIRVVSTVEYYLAD